MLSHLQYTILTVLCVILALFALVALFQFLRKLTEKEAKEKDWYRYVAPTVLALILAGFFNDIGAGSIWQWVYFLIVAIGLPLALAFFLLRDNLEKKNERIMVIVALLFLLNAAVYTALWCQHYRTTHALDENDENYNGNNNKNNGEDENPHLSKRNVFLIPLWVLTVVVGAAAGFLHHKHKDQREKVDNSYLPF